jgi:hypothetical protein
MPRQPSGLRSSERATLNLLRFQRLWPARTSLAVAIIEVIAGCWAAFMWGVMAAMTAAYTAALSVLLTYLPPIKGPQRCRLKHHTKNMPSSRGNPATVILPSATQCYYISRLVSCLPSQLYTHPFDLAASAET